MSQLLHINDNNLLIQNGRRVARSQGYAWLKGDEVIFDSDSTSNPVQHCRLAPQQINTHYWQYCEATAITKNGAGMRHAADLVWRHLGDLREHRGVHEPVLVVPSHYRESNLQLLLGIAKSSGIDAKGLVNKAVLALHDRVTQNGDYLHIDVQLHQTVTSQVSLADGKVALGSIEVLQDVGIHVMQESILKGLQQSFIQNDRFDPLHDAGTEQQLFDQIPQIARQINESGKAQVGVQHQGRLHNTSIDAKSWEAMLSPYIKKLLATGASANVQHVYVDLNAVFESSAPASLASAGMTVISELNPASASLLSSGSGESALTYLTALSVGEQILDSAVAEDAPQAPIAATTQSSLDPAAPTHLLLAGKALLMREAEVVFDTNGLSLKQGTDYYGHSRGVTGNDPEELRQKWHAKRFATRLLLACHFWTLCLVVWVQRC